ncbi:hypothetical protein ACLOJK_026333 [Asimina triloba]
MSSLSRELVFLILQFLDEEKFKESVHKLEQESGFFFNMKYFEEKAQAGEWDEVEKYLSGFTKVDDNRYSMKIFFEIRKQKYLEALDRHDRAKAVEILVKDLKVFSTFNEELYKEITQLLTLENFRENEQLSKYGDTKSARSIMLIELKKLIEANPLFREKLSNSFYRKVLPLFIDPDFYDLNWQHQLCKNPRPNPDIKTLFTDHTCTPTNGARAPTPVPVPLAAVAKPATYTPLGAHGPFPPAAAAANNALAGWMANAAASSSVQSAVVAASSIPIPPNQVSILKRPRTPPNGLGMVDYQSNDSEQLMKRLRSAAQPIDEVTYPTPVPHTSWSLDDLPRTVACTINQVSNVTSMDFHPSHQTLLLVGSSTGEISLWEVALRERLASKPFKIWEAATCSLSFQAAVAKDGSISITRVTWSPDGSLMGIAFTKQLIHLYAYQAPSDLRQVMEVWDLNGRKLYTFEGHDAPVYSVCPHHKENIQFIFSTALDGKIKAWLYDNMGSRVDYDAPGRWCTTMLYSADGSSKEGDPHLVEWNESEGAIKRTYGVFRKKSAGVVQFDTTQNHFLAVGEDSQIKFWDMDNVNILTTTDADGGLPSLPRLRFNKEGNLLAVTTADNGVKILANADGLRALRAIGSHSFEPARAPVEPSPVKVSGATVVSNISSSINRVDRLDTSSPARPSSVLNGVDPAARNVEKSRVLEDISDKTKPWELAEIVDPAQCRFVTMPDGADPPSKVARLLYTNSGVGLLALGSNATQKLWKWSRNEQNPSGKATSSAVPQHWQPSSGLLMTNDVSETTTEEAVPCIALSKNDSYVMSACGGKVSLFNMMTFKVMTTFMPPPPASTFLAFHPQDNNIIAIGMEDSTIHIYNVRVDEVLMLSIEIHFSFLQLCLWNTDTWEKRRSIMIQMPTGKAPAGDTRVQFHTDQNRLLVFHETQLAIYDASKMERIRQWVPQDVLLAPVSYAVYSCNSQLIYAAFCDGNIGVFDADSLRLRCRIAPSAYSSGPATNSKLLEVRLCYCPFCVAEEAVEDWVYSFHIKIKVDIIGASSYLLALLDIVEMLGQWTRSLRPPFRDILRGNIVGCLESGSGVANDQVCQSAYPLVIAAHPQEPNQLAIGMSDGMVKVIEPSESEGKWGIAVPLDNGVVCFLRWRCKKQLPNEEQILSINSLDVGAVLRFWESWKDAEMVRVSGAFNLLCKLTWLVMSYYSPEKVCECLLQTCWLVETNHKGGNRPSHLLSKNQSASRYLATTVAVVGEGSLTGYRLCSLTTEALQNERLSSPSGLQPASSHSTSRIFGAGLRFVPVKTTGRVYRTLRPCVPTSKISYTTDRIWYSFGSIGVIDANTGSCRRAEMPTVPAWCSACSFPAVPKARIVSSTNLFGPCTCHELGGLPHACHCRCHGHPPLAADTDIGKTHAPAAFNAPATKRPASQRSRSPTGKLTRSGGHFREFDGTVVRGEDLEAGKGGGMNDGNIRVRPVKPKLMKRLVALLLLLVLSSSADAIEGEVEGQCKSGRSLNLNPRPHSVSIFEFGAVGDGKTLNTLAFQNAIFYLRSFADKGGAQLYVPAGRWLTGSFNLISHLTLFLEKDATILGTQDLSQWPVVDPLPSYGQGIDVPGRRYRSLINGNMLKDVLSLRIHFILVSLIATGNNGTIDGQGSFWWEIFNSHLLNYSRPHLVEIENSTDVVISNLTLLNSPAWNIHPVYCSNVQVVNISISAASDSPYTDGIVPDSCSDVCIKDSYISVGHDAISLKSGWDELGIAFARPTSNVHMVNVYLHAPSGSALAFGSEMSGGISDIRVEDLNIRDSLIGIQVKTTQGRGGYIKDIAISDVEMADVQVAMALNGHIGGHPDDHFDLDAYPNISGITIKNVIGTNVSIAGNITGIDQAPFTAICLSNVSLSVASESSASWTCSYVSGFSQLVFPEPCSSLQILDSSSICFSFLYLEGHAEVYIASLNPVWAFVMTASSSSTHKVLSHSVFSLMDMLHKVLSPSVFSLMDMLLAECCDSTCSEVGRAPPSWRVRGAGARAAAISVDVDLHGSGQ